VLRDGAVTGLVFGLIVLVGSAAWPGSTVALDPAPVVVWVVAAATQLLSPDDTYVVRPFQQRATARRGEAFDYTFLIDRR
jgi:hypothetical protein